MIAKNGGGVNIESLRPSDVGHMMCHMTDHMTS